LTTENIPAVTPYDQLAAIYDKIMSHINYKHWAKYIHNMYHYYPQPVERILDISCGTGQILPYLKKKCKHTYGCDLSSAMLKTAQTKSTNDQFILWCNDARELAVSKPVFDVVVMLYDSVNYMIEKGDILRLFRNVGNCLKENGLFIFDFVTVLGCKEHFHRHMESETWENSSYVRKSWYAEEEAMQYNHFTIKINERSYVELHRQKIREIDEWEQLLNNSPLEIINFYDNFSYRPVHKISERIHVLCRKK